MNTNGPAKETRLIALIVSMLMLASVAVFGAAPQADAFSGNPCPHYSIQDVFDDPNGNWDNDQVSNSDELYNGMNPCISDTAEFCAGGGNPLCYYPRTTYRHYSNPCQISVNSFPNADYDGDGISNATEVRNGANPCTHPCPNPRSIDLALNPNGSWDNDGISNAIEVNQGTNPCSDISYRACPSYTIYQINRAPHGDWDRDGITNLNEHHQGTNPCVANNVTRYVTKQTQTRRLPHVNAPQPVYQPPRPAAVCPVNYPYYHQGSGLCYANPVRVWY